MGLPARCARPQAGGSPAGRALPCAPGRTCSRRAGRGGTPGCWGSAAPAPRSCWSSASGPGPGPRRHSHGPGPLPGGPNRAGPGRAGPRRPAERPPCGRRRAHARGWGELRRGTARPRHGRRGLCLRVWGWVCEVVCSREARRRRRRLLLPRLFGSHSNSHHRVLVRHPFCS